MDRTTADRIAGVVVALVFVIGLLVTWDAFQEYQAFQEFDGMGHMNGAIHAPTNPLWYLLGTLVLASVLALGYVAIRDQFVDETAAVGSSTSAGRAASSVGADTNAGRTDSRPLEQATADSHAGASGMPGSGATDDGSTTGTDGEEVTAESAPAHRRKLLDVLPEDERRILEPVLESPGLTQIELRDRADFSKSKVSQTVSDLEKRGLLYREPQGRTYRIYPADDLELDGN